MLFQCISPPLRFILIFLCLFLLPLHPCMQPFFSPPSWWDVSPAADWQYEGKNYLFSSRLFTHSASWLIPANPAVVECYGRNCLHHQHLNKSSASFAFLSRHKNEFNKLQLVLYFSFCTFCLMLVFPTRFVISLNVFFCLFKSPYYSFPLFF